MTLDIAMGGSTNTVLHLLASEQEVEVDFTMDDINRLSRRVPQLCKVAPSTQKYHMEDVHRAGGMIGILGELDRAGLLNSDMHNVLGKSLTETLNAYDVMLTDDDAVKGMYSAEPRAFVPHRRAHRIAAGSRWIPIVNRAVSVRVSTPTARIAVWRCCTATSRKKTVS